MCDLPTWRTPLSGGVKGEPKGVRASFTPKMQFQEGSTISENLGAPLLAFVCLMHFKVKVSP